MKRRVKDNARWTDTNVLQPHLLKVVDQDHVLIVIISALQGDFFWYSTMFWSWKSNEQSFIVNFKYKILIIWFLINFYSSQFGSEMIWMIIKLKSCLLLKRKLTVQIGNVFLFSILFDIKFFRYHHSDENKNLFNFLNKIEMCSCEKKWIFT